MVMDRNRLFQMMVGCLLTLVFPQAALPAENILEEVTVTVSRRSSSLQETAAAVTAMRAEDLASRSVTELSEIQAFSPGLHITEYQGDTSIFIRGIGTPVIIAGNDSSTGTYVDGVYLSRAAAIGPAFFDVARVEVLRGPQGTLYGRNATGGAVNIVTNRPGDEFSVQGRLSAGDYGLLGFEGAMDLPLAGNFRARLAVKHVQRDGYSKLIRANGATDDVEDRDDTSFRATFEWDVTDNTLFTLSADYYEADDTSKVFTYASAGYAEEIPNWYLSREGIATGAYFAFKNAGRATPKKSRDIYSDVAFANDAEIKGVAAVLDHAFSWGDLKLSLSQKDTNPYHQNEFDLSDAFVNVYQREEDHEQDLAEFQVTSSNDAGFEWVVGGYYFEEENVVTNNIFGDFWEPILVQGLTDLQAAGVLPPFPVVFPQSTLCCELHLNGDQQTEAWSVYAEGTWTINDRFELTVGGRYSDEERDGHQLFDLVMFSPTGGGPIRVAPEVAFFPNAVSGTRDGVTPDPFGFVVAPVDGPKSFDAFTPKVVLSYHPSADVMLYGSVQRGFKSGGYNIGSSQRGAFEPEKIWAYELGFKGDLNNARLRLNSAIFFYDYTNLQAQDSVQNQPLIRNVGKAEVLGVEVESRFALTDNFHVDAAITWLDAEFTRGTLTEPLRPAPLTQTPGTFSRDLDGLTLPRAPEWQANLGLQGDFPMDRGNLMVRLDYHWQSEIYFTVFNVDAASEDSYGFVNLRAEYQQDNWRLALFGKNLTDEEYFTNQILTGSLYGAEFVGALGAPRTAGVELSFQF